MRDAAKGAAAAALLLATAWTGEARAATEDIEFIAEHLPEVAMDNRYATLPLWAAAEPEDGVLAPGVALGYTRTGSGQLQLSGPTLALSVRRGIAPGWSLTGYAFFGRPGFSGSGESRPLDTVAIPGVPLPLPAEAIFDSLGGRMEHTGLGVAIARTRDTPRLGLHRWVVGLQAERARLDGYAFDYRIVSGPARGTAGRIDFSANYDHVTPLAGIEFPHERSRWAWSPHALVAVPLPRRGIVTRLTGPGFDLKGASDTAGRGKHFGDPYIAIGLELTYRPWGLSIDLGSTLAQAALEPVVHRGVERNLSVAVALRR